MTAFLQREAFFKRLDLLMLALYIPVALLTCWYMAKANNHYSAFQAVLFIAVLILPPLFSRLTKLRLSADLLLIYHTFTFCAIVGGSAWMLYGRFPYWDKLLHFSSGLLIAAAGLVFYHLFSATRTALTKENLLIAVAFSQCFNLAIAGIWEIYEYLLNLLTGIDAQNVLGTGVGDTMQDMIVCLLGGLVTAFLTYRQVNRGKSSFLLNTYEQLLRINHRLDEKQEESDHETII